jgi:AcrR family transcriptional regulator
VTQAMARRTKDERRTDYLDIGVDLVVEAGGDAPPDPGLALAHVRIAEVARRAGVTKGALYHLWDSQEDYWSDLLRYMLDDGRMASLNDVPAVSAELVEQLGRRPSVAEWANHVFDHFKDEPTFFARIGIFSYLHDSDVRERIDAEFHTGLKEFSGMIGDAVARFGRRSRPGATLDELTVAVAALLQGLCLEYRIDPARTPDLEVDGERVSTFATGTQALFEAFAEPIPDGEEA